MKSGCTILTEKKTLIYSIFHLNLAFSSIDQSQHRLVIKQCYWPLLNIIEQHNIPIGIELTAYTLGAIFEIDPLWVETLAKLLKQGKCELIASGDSQIIGPLVPAIINENNIRLGNLAYQKYLDIRPNIAYVNEQAISSGLLDCYIDQEFDAVIIEWDNPYSHNQGWSESTKLRPQSLLSASGRKIKVLWNYAVAFQTFQRYVHNEMILADYQHYLDSSITHNYDAFIIYGSDVEVFGYRPVRYKTEAQQLDGEWERIIKIFLYLQQVKKYQWAKPYKVLSTWKPAKPLKIQNASQPISVKKQPKYNITRWGVSGRNDLWLNSLCYKNLALLNTQKNTCDDEWRQLCRFWASDYRTHLTQQRYNELIKSISLLTLAEKSDNNLKLQAKNKINYKVNIDEERNRIQITTDFIKLVLNARRGLSIHSLSFKSQNFTPIIGTLPHGFFNHINYEADFYSNHLVIERFRQRDRITDLANVSWNINEEKNALILDCQLSTLQGKIKKWYKIKEECLECGFEFFDTERPEASVRLGYMTLLNCDKRSWFATHNGGRAMEFFEAKEDFDYGRPISSMVSANMALGATEGKLFFGNNNNGIVLSWSPEQCAALPMLSSQNIHSRYLNRLWFSLVESDETLKAGGTIMNFNYQIKPCQRPYKNTNA